MLNVLLESRANGERRRGGTVASVVLHTAVIVGAVVATASGTQAPRKDVVVPGVVWRRIDPPTVAAPEQPVRGTVSAGRVAPAAPSSPALPDLSKIPIGIPPVGGPPVLDQNGLLPRAPSFTGTGDLYGPRIGSGVGSEPYQPDAVEVLATLLPNAPSPAYPDMLRRAGVTGRVLVRLVVDTTGRVEPASIQILASAHDLLEEEVRRVLPRYRFRPAEVDGKKVRMLVELPFDFALR